jgi:predicted nucleic acid-binding protein
MTAMADSLYRFSQLYAADKLDEPRKMDALIQRAQAALAGLPETKETKEVNARIQAALKKARK